MRVLIVEDEFLLALDVSQMVEDLGHEVVGPAGSYSQAVEAIDSAEIALVDVRLSDGFTGPDIAAHLVNDHAITVVFVTGNPEAVYENPDAVGVLTKPYCAGQIAEAINLAMACHNGTEPPKTRYVKRLPITFQ
jgi:DNA-binding LytR/AlgR family response regulator